MEPQRVKEEFVDDGRWEAQEDSPMWNPKEEGETLIGEVLKIEEGMYGKQYVILDLRKKKELRTPSHKVLQNRMQNIQVGDTVRITFTHEEPPAVKGQNPLKMYTVDKRKRD